MPVYNASKYLEASVYSVLNQNYSNIELLVIDDSSTDDSLSILNRISTHDNRCKVIALSKNGGQSRARNEGFKYASGDFIYYMDSDDILPIDAITLMVVQMDEDTDLVIGDCITKGVDNVKLYSLKFDNNINLYNHYHIEESFADGKWNSAPWAKLIRKEFLKSNNIDFFEGIVMEDELWNFKVAYYAKKIKIIKNIVYEYYIRENSTMSQGVQNKHISSMIIIVNEMACFLKNKKDNVLTKSLVTMAFRLVASLNKKPNNDIKTKAIYKKISYCMKGYVFNKNMFSSFKIFCKSLLFLLPVSTWNTYIKILNKRL